MKIKYICLCLIFSSTLLNASQLNLFALLSGDECISSQRPEAETLGKQSYHSSNQDNAYFNPLKTLCIPNK